MCENLRLACTSSGSSRVMIKLKRDEFVCTVHPGASLGSHTTIARRASRDTPSLTFKIPPGPAVMPACHSALSAATFSPTCVQAQVSGLSHAGGFRCTRQAARRAGLDTYRHSCKRAGVPCSLPGCSQFKMDRHIYSRPCQLATVWWQQQQQPNKISASVRHLEART